MANIQTILRIAYLDLLSTIKINDVIVPVFDAIVPLNETIPVIKGAECYILIVRQDKQEAIGNMCHDRKNLNIVLKVACKYPKGSGGNSLAESIGYEIENKTKNNRSALNNLVTGFYIEKITDVDTGGLMPEFGDTHTIFNQNIIYRHKINLPKQN